MSGELSRGTRLFGLGRTVITPGYRDLDPLGLIAPILFQRHQRGDWGDISDENRAENDFSVTEGYRILSSYAVKGVPVWCITEADRSVTTLLLPSEY